MFRFQLCLLFLQIICHNSNFDNCFWHDLSWIRSRKSLWSKVGRLDEFRSKLFGSHFVVSGEDGAESEVQGFQRFEEQIRQQPSYDDKRRQHPEEARRKQIAVDHKQVHVVTSAREKKRIIFHAFHFPATRDSRIEQIINESCSDETEDREPDRGDENVAFVDRFNKQLQVNQNYHIAVNNLKIKDFWN